MEIRQITKNDDFPSVRELYYRSWKFAYRDIIPMEWIESRPKDKWGGNITENGRTEIGAFEDGRIVGTASFGASRWEKFGGYGEIVTIYLLPEYMGSGVGSALMERCISELKAQGYSRILLWVLEENTRARRFYEKHGFRGTAEFMDDNIGGRAVREVMYLLEI